MISSQPVTNAYVPNTSTTHGSDARVSSPATKRATRVFLALLMVWGSVLIAIRTAYPGLELGDGLNDADILHASNWFAQHGYRGTAFMPVRETAYHPDYWPPTYNTFPPGVFYLHEIERHLGLSELWHFRVVGVLLSMLAVWLWFFVARRLTGSAVIAALAAALYMLSRPVVSYAAGMWEHVPMLSLFATLAAWLQYETADSRGKRGLWLALAAGAMFLDAWLTLQHSVMLALIICTRVVCRWAWGRTLGAHGWRGLFVLMVQAAAVCSMPALVAAIRFYQQYMLAGSVAHALEYFTDPLMFRLGDERFSLSRGDVVVAWLRRLGMPESFRRMFRISPQVLYPAFTMVSMACVAILGAALIRRWREAESMVYRKALLSALLLLAGAFTWPLVMKQHAYMHSFPVLMFLPGVTLLLAGACVWGLSRAKKSGALGAVALSVLAITPLVGPVYGLKRSDTLNRVVRLDREVHQAVRTHAQRLNLFAVVSRRLEPERVLRIAPRWPATPYMLDRPFYQFERPLDARWVKDESVVLDLDYLPASRFAAALALGLGIPDVISAPGDLAFFPPRLSDADSWTRSKCVNMPFVPGASLVEARVAKSMDEGCAIASILIDGPVLPREAASSALIIESINERGTTTFSEVVQLSAVRTRVLGGWLGRAQPTSAPAMLIMRELPLEALRPGGNVRMKLYGPESSAEVILNLADAPNPAPLHATVPRK